MQKNEAERDTTIESVKIIDENNSCETRTTFICNQIVDRIAYYVFIMIVLYVFCTTANAISKFMLHTIQLEEKAFLHKHLRGRHSVYLNGNW